MTSRQTAKHHTVACRHLGRHSPSRRRSRRRPLACHRAGGGWPGRGRGRRRHGRVDGSRRSARKSTSARPTVTPASPGASASPSRPWSATARRSVGTSRDRPGRWRMAASWSGRSWRPRRAPPPTTFPGSELDVSEHRGSGLLGDVTVCSASRPSAAGSPGPALKKARLSRSLMRPPTFSHDRKKVRQSPRFVPF